MASAMIAGGAFCPFQEVHLAWQDERGLWAGTADGDPADSVKPYGQGRSGTLPGEAGALFLFEERDHALERGATILAEVCGFAQRFFASTQVQQGPPAGGCCEPAPSDRTA